MSECMCTLHGKAKSIYRNNEIVCPTCYLEAEKNRPCTDLPREHERNGLTVAWSVARFGLFRP